MTDIAKARDRISRYLQGCGERRKKFGSALPGYKGRPNPQLVVVKEAEYDFGWVFFWNTKEFVETGDHRHALVGNAPLIVDRKDGGIYITGTAHELEHYLEEYRRGKRRPAANSAG